MNSPSQPASRKRTKATSIDIAHAAGVSQATVSRVLRGSPLVNAETRKRVEEAVRALNYKVDRHASSLRTQRAGELLVESLVRLVRGEAAESTTLPASLVVRRSTGA